MGNYSAVSGKRSLPHQPHHLCSAPSIHIQLLSHMNFHGVDAAWKDWQTLRPSQNRNLCRLSRSEELVISITRARNTSADEGKQALKLPTQSTEQSSAAGGGIIASSIGEGMNI